MQCILSIDLSYQPCEFTLSRVEGTNVEVLSRSTAKLPLFTNRALLRSTDLRRVLHSSTPNSSTGGPQNLAEESVTIEGAESDVVWQTVDELRRVIQSFEPVWSSSSVILPQAEHLALNLDLPFGDPKNLDRIVDLEVQDVVPFELEEFFVQYSSLGPLSIPQPTPQAGGAQQFDVHIGILPRLVVQNILEICKAAGLEPNVLTVPSSAIGAAFHIGKSFFTTNSALVLNRGDEYAIALYINGEVRVERSVYASQILSAASPDTRGDQFQHIFTAIKVLLAAAERRYNTRIEKIFLLGREVKTQNSQQIFGRPLEGLPFKELFRSSESQIGLAPLSAMFAQDDALTSPLSNFRSREFSFTPRFGEFLRALFNTRRFMARAAIGVMVALAVVYGAREYTIRSAQNTLAAEIQRLIPTFSSSPSSIRETLLKEENKLAEELGAFGSRAKSSPSDVFLDIIRVLPDASEIAVTSLKVSGIRAQLSGTASDLAAIERFQKVISAKKEVFAKVDAKSSRAGSRFNFNIDVVLTQ
jgi:hypothetical protein